MYSVNGYDQLSQPVAYNGRSEQQQRDMEAAFERALGDARAQTSREEVQTQEKDEEEIDEIVREPKGDLEAVWESLRPEAERLGKLAEWEKDFSQVSDRSKLRCKVLVHDPEIDPSLVRVRRG